MFSHLEFPDDDGLIERRKGDIIDQLAESATVYSACSPFSALSGNSDERFYSISRCYGESDETGQTGHLLEVTAAATATAAAGAIAAAAAAALVVVVVVAAAAVVVIVLVVLVLAVAAAAVAVVVVIVVVVVVVVVVTVEVVVVVK